MHMHRWLTTVLFLIIIFVTCSLPEAWAAGNGEMPRVVSTTPVNGAEGVDPALPRISVTFNKAMQEGSWSWSYEDRNSFPAVTGQPYHTEDGRTCVLPVNLKPDTRYVIWINTERFRNFRDRSGNPVAPFRFVFTTVDE